MTFTKRSAKNSKGKRSRRAKSTPKSGLSGFEITKTAFPAKWTGIQTYCKTIVLTPAAGLNAVQSFRVNSVYDPDFTGVGATALSYSVLSALYNKYRVISARISVELNNTGAAPVTVLMVASNSSSLSTSLAVNNPQRFTRRITLAAAGSGPVTSKFVFNVPVHTIYGVPAQAVLFEDDYAGNAGGNPNNAVYFHVDVHDFGAIAASVYIDTIITYRVHWELPLVEAA